MKIGPKLILTIFVVVSLGSVGQVIYRFIVDRNQLELELRLQANNTLKRLLNGLAQPVWNFDDEMINTIMRLELADFNLQAIEFKNIFGEIKHFLGRLENNSPIQNLLTENEEKLSSFRESAYFTLRENLSYQDQELGEIFLYFTNDIISNKIWHQTLELIIQSLIIAIILMLILWITLQKIIVKPIIELTTVVLKIFQSNDLTIRSPIRSEDEIGILSKQYNNMLDIIESYTKDLEKKVDERTRDLAEANSVLKKQKDEIDRNLQIAQKIQLNLIPNERTYPVRSELKFNGLYKAMDAVGGDIFDVIRCGRNSYGILMADVSGHGIPAALVTAMAKVSFNTHAQHYGILTSEVCSKVNKDIIRLLGNEFTHYLTAFFGIIDLEKKTFSWTNCGHHPALLIRRDTVLSLGTPSPFIGYLENAVFNDESIELEKADRIVLYTDGIVEAKNDAGELYDTPRLISLCRTNYNETSQVLLQKILDDLKNFCGDMKADDDRAVLIVDYLRGQTSSTSELNFQSGKIFESEKSEIQTHLQEALISARQGHYSEALNLLERLFESYPNNIKIIINLSLVLYKVGQHQRALKILQEAYEANKNDRLNHLIAQMKDKIKSSI